MAPEDLAPAQARIREQGMIQAVLHKAFATDDLLAAIERARGLSVPG
jgi:hypothetical protein